MSNQILEYHRHRFIRPDKDSDVVALFLFSLTPESHRSAGLPVGQDHAFWTEVRLSRDLAARGGWATLSQKEKAKCMYRFAVERIQERGGKLRDAPMFWTATSVLKDGPPWDPASIDFPPKAPIAFEPSGGVDARSREGAGLAG